MKIILGFILVSIFMISGCKSNSNKKKCSSMIEHMYDLTTESPKFDNLEEKEKEELMETLRGEFDAKRDSSIEECSKDFNEELYNCVMKSETVASLANCK